MDKEIKAKWVEALRSGKYKQERRALHPTADSFCCLGVLCDVLEEEWQPEEGYFFHDADGNTELLSRRITKRAGLSDDDPVVERGGLTTLSRLNDGTFDTAALSFSEIADLIEAQL